MIYIKKQAEPHLFLWYRQQPDAHFDDMDSAIKEQLRGSLLKEQGHICAYCMRQITGAADVKIEHIEARTPENELIYQNFSVNLIFLLGKHLCPLLGAKFLQSFYHRLYFEAGKVDNDLKSRYFHVVHLLKYWENGSS